MNHLPMRIVKVGGSLFDLPDLAQRLRHWLADQPPAHHVLLAGGGKFVDQVRERQRSSGMSDTDAHWACIDCMQQTAKMLSTWLPGTPLISDERLLSKRAHDCSYTLFDSADWLRHREPQAAGTKLGKNWQVTSDSIAARLAIVLSAEELLLLKSMNPKSCQSLQELANCGAVDVGMLALAGELPTTRIVNLRDIPHRTSDVLPGRMNA